MGALVDEYAVVYAIIVEILSSSMLLIGLRARSARSLVWTERFGAMLIVQIFMNFIGIFISLGHNLLMYSFGICFVICLFTLPFFLRYRRILRGNNE